ncbi:MAG TPA: flagellar biosynthesis anti-sigma factor FlgM [Chloroflexota bacterium]|nr:flagellar biosynthesis anti-sigma factor FlgM [Chloroflexota bacterium]
MDIERISQRQTDPAEIAGQAAARRAERASNDSQVQADPQSVRSSSDTVEISSRSRELARARQAVDAAPDVRADKVAEIKQRIEDGTYSVSPELLARKMLEGSDG